MSALSHLFLGGRAEGGFELLLLLLVQLREAVWPEGGACQSLTEDGVHWRGLEPGAQGGYPFRLKIGIHRENTAKWPLVSTSNFNNNNTFDLITKTMDLYNNTCHTTLQFVTSVMMDSPKILLNVPCIHSTGQSRNRQ